jgi:secreted protein with Ig-like and vWFA domain
LGEDRSAVHAAVSNLVADGGTNLENGILLLKDLLQESQVDSVFLLTDGHINEGLHSGNALLRILGSRSTNVDLPPLHTLGFGSDYNIKTLQTLSIATRGSHTYADAAERIPDIIGDIVGGLASEVGRNGTLHIPTGWRCLELGSLEGATS